MQPKKVDVFLRRKKRLEEQRKTLEAKEPARRPKADAVVRVEKGEKGEKGDRGESIKGDKGDKGDPGESIKGDKGDKGDCAKINAGRGAPKDADSQLYIDVESGDVWLYS